jgi:hypothetical protein
MRTPGVETTAGEPAAECKVRGPPEPESPSSWPAGAGAAQSDLSMHGPPEPKYFSSRSDATDKVWREVVSSRNCTAQTTPETEWQATEEEKWTKLSWEHMEYRWSRGAEFHGTEKGCKPCMFMSRKGCRKGAECAFCHWEHEPTKEAKSYSSRSAKTDQVRRPAEVGKPGLRNACRWIPVAAPAVVGNAIDECKGQGPPEAGCKMPHKEPAVVPTVAGEPKSHSSRPAGASAAGRLVVPTRYENIDSEYSDASSDENAWPVISDVADTGMATGSDQARPYLHWDV